MSWKVQASRAVSKFGAVAARSEPVASLGQTRLDASPFLSRPERQALEDAALFARAVPAGASLVGEGEATDRLIVVISGWAGRFKTTRSGDRQIIGLALPGDLANLNTMLLARSGYGVRAFTDVHAVAFDRQRVLQLASQHPGIARTLTWLALVETEWLGQWLMCLGRQSAMQRLAHLFCELSARLDGQPHRHGGYELPLTQEHIADLLGLTPVHVNRTMQQLRANGLVTISRRSFSVLNVRALESLADFHPGYLHQQPDADLAGLAAC